MAFSKGKSSVCLEDILNITSEIDILAYYLGITQIPCLIKSPFREDKKPSFGLYSKDGKKVYFKDFANNESGSTFDLLGKLWECNYTTVLDKIYKDLSKGNKGQGKYIYNIPNKKSSYKYTPTSSLECKVREWRSYDIEYWNSFGISLEWLRYAEVYPISHKIIKKDNQTFIYGADKYAYAFVEHKDNKTTLKIYQPFNKNGYKWSNKHDSSVISLWTKIPKRGKNLCICSSLKDALCLWANVGIPSIAVQGEGYSISDTAIKQLKERYENIYILFDNDEVGLKDGEKLAKETGFQNIILPFINDSKDVSDLYLSFQNKEKFKQIILTLFKN